MSFAFYSEIAAAFPWFFPAVAFIFGACIGSFLNVVIYRLPKEESVVRPGSHCGCGQPIAWRDNIPILSWLFLRGRARCCGRPFSARYPFVELLTGLLFLGCWLSYTQPLVALCGMVLLSALIAATFIDLDHFIIPDAFTLGLGVAGLLLSLAVPALHGQQTGDFPHDALRSGTFSLLGSLVGSALVLWIGMIGQAVLKKEAMGFGDVKFVGGIGAFCGWQGAVFAVFGGALVATIWFLLALLWQRVAGKPSPVALPVEKPVEDEPSAPNPLEDIALGTAVLAASSSFLVPVLQAQDSGIYFLDSVRSGGAALRGLLIGSGFVLWIGLLVEVAVRKEFIPFSVVKFAGAVGALTVWSQGWVGVLRGTISAAAIAGVVSASWWLIQLVRRRRVPPATAPEPPSSSPVDEAPPALGFGMHVPFGPMLAIAAALYFLVFRSWFAAYFAEFAALF